MKVVYGTPWIEIEFGERSEGWKLFLDREQAIEETKKDSATGFGNDQYIGPVRPLVLYQIPHSSLSKKLKQQLKTHKVCFTPEHWTPDFKDQGTRIT